MRILGVDPGEKNIGLAISDPSGTFANPLGIIKHISRVEDATRIVQMAEGNNVGTIVVGQALGTDNEDTLQSRRSSRLAAAIRQHTSIPVILWDESGSTEIAKQTQRLSGISRRSRQNRIDHLAASVILQSYLDRDNP